ncbi:MAG: CPBP family intramembrane glutamic endopeptidase [Pseudomonadota bacterium]
MIIERYRHPWLFYGLSTAIPWALWFAAAYLSHLSPANELLAVSVGVLGVAGLFAPAFIAYRMIWPDTELRTDIKRRLFNLKGIQPIHLLMTGFLMLGSILLAQAISLLFGHSTDQFVLAGASSFSAGIFPGWFLLFLAPLVEELAWHSYGTDCLRVRMNLFKASMVFAVFWAFWHLPLSFIKDYYHSNVAETGLLYSLNFAFSLIPFVILMNWLYYKTDRNILIAIVFHITAGWFNEMFATHPDSKVIQTVLLTLLSLYLLYRDRDFFFERRFNEGKRS